MSKIGTNKKKNDLTALFVLHSEEKTIGRALRSVQEAINDTLVIHDGKYRDGAINICCKFDCRVAVDKLSENVETCRAKFYKMRQLYGK